MKPPMSKPSEKSRIYWDVHLERTIRRPLPIRSFRGVLSGLVGSIGRYSVAGFTGKALPMREGVEFLDPQTSKGMYRHALTIRVNYDEVTQPEKFEERRKEITGILIKAGMADSRRKWLVPGTPENPEETRVSMAACVPTSHWDIPKVDADASDSPRPTFVPPESLSEATERGVFEGIYDREFHIHAIHLSVLDYFDSLRAHAIDPRNEVARNHTLLYGKPASCKTTVLKAFKAWYERDSDVERVLFIDAHTMTKAGLENFLLEKARSRELPEIIVLEEIEKHEPTNLLALISLMGSGFISKMNAHIGFRREIANVLIWATCNNEEVIRNFRGGVLWSRFGNKFPCTRPSRELMTKILLKAVLGRGGNPAWVHAAIDFAYDEMRGVIGRPMDDPREIKALLAAKDFLLDGSYQRGLVAALQADASEKQADKAYAQRVKAAE
jgi:hypothetical protein